MSMDMGSISSEMEFSGCLKAELTLAGSKRGPSEYYHLCCEMIVFELLMLSLCSPILS